MKRLEQYIPLAIDVVEDLFLKEYSTIDPEFNGLILKFGLAVRQLGLRTAVIAYSSSKKDLNQKEKTNERLSAEDRKLLITKAILRILILHEVDRNLKDTTLKELVIRESDNLHLLTNKVMDASIALKLAFRIYTKSEDLQNNIEEEKDE